MTDWDALLGIRPEDMSPARRMALALLVNVAGALVILVVGWLLARLLTRLVQSMMRRGRVDATLVSFLGNLANTILLVAVVVAALARLGVPTSSALAVLGAAGLAVALALQSSLSNLAAGVMIIAFRLFRVGDQIELGAAKGRVLVIDIFHTRLATPDNVEIVLPNNTITTGMMKNYSALPDRRIDLTITLPSQSDSPELRKKLIEIVTQDPRVLSEPSPSVGVSQVTDGKTVLSVRCWAPTASFADLQASAMTELRAQLDVPNLSIAVAS